MDKLRKIWNAVFMWGDTHRRASLGIICFVLGFLSAVWLLK